MPLSLSPSSNRSNCLHYFHWGLEKLHITMVIAKNEPIKSGWSLTLVFELDAFLTLERQNNTQSLTPMASSVNQVAASNSQRDTVNELSWTLRSGIEIFKSSNNGRKIFVERDRQQYNFSDRHWNRNNSRDQTLNGYDSSERIRERRSRENDNLGYSRYRNGGSSCRWVRFKEDRGRQQYYNRSSNSNR